MRRPDAAAGRGACPAWSGTVVVSRARGGGRGPWWRGGCGSPCLPRPVLFGPRSLGSRGRRPWLSGACMACTSRGAGNCARSPPDRRPCTARGVSRSATWRRAPNGVRTKAKARTSRSPCHSQPIAHRGACGKAPVVAQNLRAEPVPTASRRATLHPRPGAHAERAPPSTRARPAASSGGPVHRPGRQRQPAGPPHRRPQEDQSPAESAAPQAGHPAPPMADTRRHPWPQATPHSKRSERLT